LADQQSKTMKMRTLTIVCVGGAVSSLLSGWAFNPPATPPLPDYDQRTAAPTRAVSALPGQTRLGAFTPAQQQAAAALRQRVSGLSVEPDRIIGAPRLIASTEGFLTGPGGQGGAVSAASLNALPANDPHRVIKAFLNEHAALFGHDAGALASANVKRDYVTAHNGLRTVVFEQTFAGIPVHEAALAGCITRQGELVRLSSQFVPDVGRAVANGVPNWPALSVNPPISAAMAVVKAAANIGTELPVGAVVSLSAPEGATMKQKLKAPPALKGEAYAQLIWLPLNREAARLCWQVILVSKARVEMYLVLVDAETGEVLVRRNQTRYQVSTNATPATYRVFVHESPSPFSPGWPYPSSEQPPVVPRELVTNLVSLSPVGSPNGWLAPRDANGFYQTMGNNVDAHTDLDDDDVPDIPRPSSWDVAVFDFDLDLTLQPISYTNAAVVNLFYWCNLAHDRYYDLGFTEAAGNMQNNNFGRGGLGGDALQADAQDGGGTDNAFASPTPDGFPPRITMWQMTGPRPWRDSDLDAELVLHEFTHCVTERHVANGNGFYYYGQTGGQSEGYSDFFCLALTSESSDDPNGCYAQGAYSFYMLYDFTENYYFGGRRYPYCTDMLKNPLTLKDVDPTQADPHGGVPINPLFAGYSDPSEVHNQGEFWCMTLWEVRANLIDSFGGDEGNWLAMQVVVDGMELCPPNPTYVETRDAILQADLINNGGANRSEIWLGFAKRGLGLSASVPTWDTTVGVVEAFDVPDDVATRSPDGVLEVSVNPLSDTTLFGGSNTPIFVRVRDGVAVTNATVRAKVNGTTDLPFNNTGRAPDARAQDSIYSALLAVPANGTTITLTIDVTAPGKTNATLAVNYFIASVPVNDFFAKAIKVKAPGDLFVSNNKFATLEASEPVHAGATNMGASLWYDWTPTNNARVLVDTAGSAFKSILAVYSGNTLPTLKQVKSASSVPERKQVYLFFDAQKGVNYHIVAASANTNDAGLLRFRIVPGGQPDITPPLVTIAQPLNGRVFTNNMVDIQAIVTDPEPNASGVDKVTFWSGPRPFGETATVAAAGGATTNLAKLALSKGRNTITVYATDVAGNASAPASITVTYRPLDPPNDHFIYAWPLAGVSGNVAGNNRLATKEPGEPQHANNPGGHSLWWWWQAPANGSLLLSTEGSNFDTIMGLYTGNRVDSLTTIAFNDDAFEGAKFSKLHHAVRSNQVYHVAVDGFMGATGVVQLAYSFVPTNIFSVNLTQTPGGQLLPSAGVFDVEADSTLTIAATPDNNYEFGGWQGDVSSAANPLSIPVNKNLTLQAVFRSRVFADDFESGDLSKLAWRSGGALPWVVTNTTAATGKSAARSGAIGNNQTSSLLLTAQFRGGTASFDYRVSSEQGWDWLQFYVDGQLQQQWSGEVDWMTWQFSLSAGEHTLEWRYAKDAVNSIGLDAAFIDNVDLPLQVPLDSSSAARLSMVRLPGGGVQVFLKGQTNQFYAIQATAGFPGQWQTIFSDVARQGEIWFTDPAMGDQPARFYRAVAR
jgi:hypothetical protein